MILIIPLCILIGFLSWRLRPRRLATRSGKIALLATIIPPAVMVIVAVALQLAHNTSGVISVAEASNSLFMAALIFIGLSILVLVGLVLFRENDIVKNSGFGLCMACFIIVIELGLLEWLGGV